jgi:hypothetical protein
MGSALLYKSGSEVNAMDIRLGSVQPDSTRYSDEQSKRAKRVKTKSRQDEECWSERSDYEEIEDLYTPSEPGGKESAE